LETKDELLAKITTYMAGRAAEMLQFKSATSGAANDIENATRIARAMITMYGMSDRFGMMCLATVEHQYLSGGAGLICGENTASQIDEEVLAVINTCYNNAYQMLEENKEILDKISDYLFEKETITGKEFMKMFREMKGLPDPEETTGVSEQNPEIFAEEADEFHQVLTEMTEAQKKESVEKNDEKADGLEDECFEEE
jgi:cell division protease FtsH